MSASVLVFPVYPLTIDVWDKLKTEKRPIMVYGMGNGADKLFDRFSEYGIEVKEVFASDGFVRGHSYRGYLVKSFSDIKAAYEDFVIVISFASNKPDVVDMLREIDAKYETYMPDMPIAEVSEYFDKEFFNNHYEEIRKAYELLEDEESKKVYLSVLNFRLSGKLSYLLEAYSSKEELYSLINQKEIKTVIDAGAYNGDTAKEAVEYFTKLERLYAIEPDKRNFKKLSRYLDSIDIETEAINSAVWSECRAGSFSSSANRNSTLLATASFEHKDDEVSLVTIDSLSLSSVDYIKYDVEGAEKEALVGSYKTVEDNKPVLLVSLYHKSKDIFSLPLYLNATHKGYKFYMRRLYCLPAWELDLIMIPDMD
jgi:FkbM family methyltransferase